MFSVCVCFFGIYVLKIVVERWFWGFIRLFGSLVELYAWLHSYLYFSPLEKLFLSNLDSFSTPGYLSSFSTSFYRNLDSVSTARWIDRQTFWTLDSFSTVGGLIELLYYPFCWIVPRQIIDSCICRSLFGSTPVSTPLSVEIHWTPVYMFSAIRFSLFSISLSTDPSLHLPNTLFSLKTFNSHDFRTLLASNHLVCSLISSFFMHFMHLDLGFGVFEKIWGFSKLLSFCWNFGMGFWLNDL